jgi:hypothetical protein
MVFASKVPIANRALQLCFPIGLSSPQYDLLTHHFAFGLLSFKTVSKLIAVKDHLLGRHAAASSVSHLP